MDELDSPLEHLLSTLETPARVRGDVSEPDTLAQALIDSVTGTPGEQAEAMESMAHAATLPHEEDHAPGCALCQRCEVFPRPMAGRGSLHLNMPHTHTLGKVLVWLTHAGAKYTRRDGTVVVDVGEAGPGDTLAGVAGVLASTERRDSRALFQPAGELLQAADYFRIESLTTMLAKESSRWLLDMLREDRLTSHFQPIVTADGRAVYAYECLMRGRGPAGVVMPGAILDAARRSDLVFQVDQAGRKAAVVAAVAQKVTAHKVFINFTPNAIYDPTHCLDSTVRMVDDGGLERGRVVFEVTEAERLPDLPHLQRIVDYYRGHGFGVALDDVGAGYASLQVLLGLKPDYVKLDMSLVRDVDREPHKAVLARKLLEACQELGLKTVAEGIETAGEWDWVRRHGADFVQGYYFARPAAVPPELAVPSA